MVKAAQQEKAEAARRERERAEKRAQREQQEQAHPAAAAETDVSIAADAASLPTSPHSSEPSTASAPSGPSPLASSSSPSPSPALSASPSFSDAENADDAEFLCVLNLCRTKYDKSVKRGAMVKSLALVTRHRFYHLFKPVLMLALDAVFDHAPIAASAVLTPVAGQAPAPVPQTSAAEVQAIIAELYSSINALTFPASLTTPLSAVDVALMTASSQPSQLAQASSAAPLTLTFLSTSFPLRVPSHLLPSEVVESSLTSLCARFQQHTMDVFSAILTGRRVIFLAYQQPASSVSSMVLSSLLLVSPPFPSLLHRAFPYTSLTNMDFLDVPGFVAGVTNPIFQQRTRWWDVLCDVSEGTVTFAPPYAEELARTGAAALSGAGDGAFWTEVWYGLQLKYGEEWLRCMFRDYTAYVLSCVQDTAVFPDLHTRTLAMEAQQPRINAVLRSPPYTQWMAQRLRPPSSTASSHPSLPYATVERLTRHVQTLQHKTPSSAELLAILSDLQALLPTPLVLHQLLALLPETQGGLLPVAQYVLHREPRVREEVVRLLRRIDDDEQGRRWVASLNYFLLMAYYKERGDQEDDGTVDARTEPEKADGLGTLREESSGTLSSNGSERSALSAVDEQEEGRQ